MVVMKTVINIVCRLNLTTHHTGNDLGTQSENIFFFLRLSEII